MSVQKFRGPNTAKDATWLGSSYQGEAQLFAVLTGVELDPYPFLLPYPEIERMAASRAAEAVLRTSIDVIHPKAALRQLGAVANASIGELNQSLKKALPGRTFNLNPYVGVVGSIGFIARGVGYYSQINQAGVETLDSDGLMRSCLRPSYDSAATEALSGQLNGSRFMRSHYQTLEPGSYVMAFSPGAAEVSMGRAFRNQLVGGAEHLSLTHQFNEGLEQPGGLIVIRHEA